jgi:S1-C subfamily serine protease
MAAGIFQADRLPRDRAIQISSVPRRIQDCHPPRVSDEVPGSRVVRLAAIAPHPSSMSPIRSLRLAVMLPVWAAVSCTTVAVRKDEPVSSWVARDSIQRKAQAAREVTSQRLAGLPMEEMFRRHSAIVSDGGMPRVTEGPDGLPQLRVPADRGYGTAVSLGEGYFLTAAHVPVEGRGGLFCMERGRWPVARSYRLVWSDRAADLALLHAEVDVPAIEWASDAEIAPGRRAFTHGFGGGEWKASHGHFAGSAPATRGSRHRDLQLSVPVVAGDSGGPVLTSQGKLAAVVTRADYRWVQLFGRAWMRTGSHATRPDRELLRSIIRADGERR